MFDISWSELLILAVVTLVFVGPKDLPRFLGMIGRYAGVVRRHANEFRQVFDQAMREAELDQMKREVEKMGEQVNASVLASERAREGALATAAVTRGPQPADAGKPEPAAASSQGGAAQAAPPQGSSAEGAA